MTLSRCISYHRIEILGLLCKRINVNANLSVSMSVYLMQSGRQAVRSIVGIVDDQTVRKFYYKFTADGNTQCGRLIICIHTLPLNADE